MGANKPNYVADPILSEIGRTSTRVNISDLIRKNKEGEKREKIIRIYTFLSVAMFIFLFGIYIIL